MKITICGSIAFFEQMQKTQKQLEKLGYEVKIPPSEIADENGDPISVSKYYEMRQNLLPDAWLWDRKKEAILLHFDKVESSDAILVLNYDKNDIKGYVGANTLMEMGLALHLGKPIFLLNDIPKMQYTEEILGMKPIVIDGNFKNISSPVGESS